MYRLLCEYKFFFHGINPQRLQLPDPMVFDWFSRATVPHIPTSNPWAIKFLCILTSIYRCHLLNLTIRIEV